ncbi:diacylglycerol/lipid kinase family protein [Ligilactobacillus agilis]|uniref:YegS/Rv2252/BmrU family lipid kinase n=1 Tax=Ligilactobacillus agilis TaxID=1601 RepID=A0A848C806_9LACO|nr:YegS/Rv2252/BmrU family lipid kinase [Ligilactobacillus agilis]MBM6763399.1 YegS/Rv2252/BmrU family lipid kinase [Ligilactobacillus agilis]MDY4065369.1 YegS/Rv2252/BmrU family lipid kinase [Ligilactobacillus agilis]NME41372.1 YegS/Rv2252/BmrU family lipid kinase [Ligilactobacillus agilis]
MKNFFVIVNEDANDGQGKKNWQLVRQKLTERQVSYTYQLTNNNAKDLAYSFVKKTTTSELTKTVILVVGGDGTLNETLNGIKAAKLDYDVPLAFIPSGNNNGFAQGIGISFDPLTALEQVLTTDKASYFDIGFFEETTHNQTGYFLNDFGIGIDAYIVSLNAHAPHHKYLQKFHLGIFSYIWNVFEAYVNQEAFNVTVRIGSKYEFYKHAFLVNVANHPYFKKNIALSPVANAGDHKLDLIIADNMNFFKFLLLSILIYFRKQLKLPSVHHYKEKDIHLIINSLEFGQIDGQEQGNKYYDIFFKASKYPFWFTALTPTDSQEKSA